MSLKTYVEKTIDEVEAFRNTPAGQQCSPDWYDQFIELLREVALLENDLDKFSDHYSIISRMRTDSGPWAPFGPNSAMLSNAVAKLNERKKR